MRMIQLKNIRKRFGNDAVINNLNLEIRGGLFTVLVGPSGCGKSTTLRMITGLGEPTSGDILIDGYKINNLTPGKRDIVMVLQNYVLYPTVTIRGSTEFGLENKKVPKEKRQHRVKGIREIVRLAEYLDRKPSTLLGDQRQRVALVRAMVRQPKVFFMDEPLSNLGAKLKGQMRVELIGLHRRLETTFVYVIHDQVGAMSMADDIVLMKDGYTVQQSNPRQLYQNPTCIYAAQLIDTPQINIMSNVPSDGMQLGFRPGKVYLQRVEEDCVSIQAEAVIKEILGSEITYFLNSVHGALTVKSEHEVEDDCLLNLSIPFSAMYLFNRERKRTDLGQPERHMIRNAFGGQERRVVSRKNIGASERRNRILGVTTAIPAMIFLVIFTVYPVFYLIYYSMFSSSLISTKREFIDLDNYRELQVSETFHKVLVNIVVYTMLFVGLAMVLMITITVWFNGSKHKKLNSTVEGFILMPHVISMVSVSIIFLWLMDLDTGFLSMIITKLGFSKFPFLSSLFTFMFPLVPVMVWESMGYYVPLIMVALRTVPSSIYETAELDGTSKTHTSFKTALPMISPTILFISVVAFVVPLKIFGSVNVVTQGGPVDSTNTLIYYIYSFAFRCGKPGMACAAGVILLVLVCIMTHVQSGMGKKKMHYQ